MIDFKKAYVLENDVVRLTPLTIEDLKHLAPFSVNEPEIWLYSLADMSSPEKIEHYINTAIEGRQHKKEYAFTVFDKRTQKYAGCTRFYDINTYHLSLQLGYTWYGKAFQGTGLNKNCKYLLLEFAFDVLNMERVEFRADYKNIKSINAMKSIGCVVEGVLRNNAKLHHGGRRDSVVLSILKNEWDTQVKQLLKEKIKAT